MNTEDLEKLEYENAVLCFLPEVLETRNTEFLKSRLDLAEQAASIGYSWAENIKGNILMVLFWRSEEHERLNNFLKNEHKRTKRNNSRTSR